MDRTTQGTQLQELLGLALPPVAIAFPAAAPAGMARIDAPAPAGCGYWRLAAEGDAGHAMVFVIPWGQEAAGLRTDTQSPASDRM